MYQLKRSIDDAIIHTYLDSELKEAQEDLFNLALHNERHAKYAKIFSYDLNLLEIVSETYGLYSYEIVEMI